MQPRPPAFGPLPPGGGRGPSLERRSRSSLGRLARRDPNGKRHARGWAWAREPAMSEAAPGERPTRDEAAPAPEAVRDPILCAAQCGNQVTTTDVGSGPILPGSSQGCAEPDVTARRARWGHPSPAARKRRTALLAGWRGRPVPRECAGVHGVFSSWLRGVARRRMAERLGVWRPAAGFPPTTPDERKAARRAVSAALA